MDEETRSLAKQLDGIAMLLDIEGVGQWQCLARAARRLEALDSALRELLIAATTRPSCNVEGPAVDAARTLVGVNGRRA